MDNSEEIIAEAQRLISKWDSGYMPVTSVTDEIHNHSDWSINDTDDLVFLATMMILMLESKDK